MYLTVIIDLFHRKVVGWAMGRILSTNDTTTPAWKMADISNAVTKKLMFHSDRGPQYASYSFTNILKNYDGLGTEAELSVFQCIETWYNRRRIHSTLGYKTIEDFENKISNQKIAV